MKKWKQQKIVVKHFCYQESTVLENGWKPWTGIVIWNAASTTFCAGNSLYCVTALLWKLVEGVELGFLFGPNMHSNLHSSTLISKFCGCILLWKLALCGVSRWGIEFLGLTGNSSSKTGNKRLFWQHNFMWVPCWWHTDIYGNPDTSVHIH